MHEMSRLPGHVEKIISILNDAGHEAYAVGGCVRDSLLGRTPSDWDITTSATPPEIKACFHRTVDTGIQHGTVTVLMGKTGYEVTTYRVDGPYEDGRHPASVEFTPELKEDLLRRDFTINAMAYHPREGIIDLFDGQRDLGNGVIRCVGEAEARFREDALRMMRAVRFAAQLGFSSHRDTYAAAESLHENIALVSAERIREELVKLVCSDHPEAIRILRATGLTGVFLPELDRMFATAQNTRHHSWDVGEHTVQVMMAAASEKEEVLRHSAALRLAALFHDIGKPETKKTDAKGIDHFVGHPQVGARMTKDIMRRLKFDNDTTDRVVRLVRFHDERPLPTRRNTRRLMARAGKDLMPELLALKRMDIAGQSDYYRREKLDQVSDLEGFFRGILADEECVTLKELAVDGRALMELGFAPGPGLGRALKELLKLVVDDPSKNSRSVLLDEAKRFM